LQSGALGAVLALAQRPLYPIHASVAPSWGLTPLEDQQLAGGLMWVPPGIVYTVVIAALLAHWLGSLEVRDREQAATVRGQS
jgi:putative membrane protein